MAEIAVTLSEADVARIADAVVARISATAPAGGDQPSGKTLWREDEAAAALGISKHTLKRFRLQGYIRAATAGKPVLYSRAQLDAAAKFLTEQC